MLAGNCIWEPIQCRTRTRVHVNTALIPAREAGIQLTSNHLTKQTELSG